VGGEGGGKNSSVAIIGKIWAVPWGLKILSVYFELSQI